MEHRMKSPDSWLQISQIKAVKNIVCHHAEQPEIQNSSLIVLVDVIRKPVVGHFTETIIFDFPSAMPKLHNGIGCRSEIWQCSCPHPPGSLLRNFILKLSMHCFGF
jgi:hypothetical protein